MPETEYRFGCSGPVAVRDLLDEADTLLRDQQYADAERTIKQYLLVHPRDAGGHFLLGRAYMGLEHLVLAQGEFETALYYFAQSGRVNPIPRFDDPEYFELICHVEISKVYQRQILLLLSLPVPPRSVIENRVEGWRRAHEAAKAIRPDWPDVIRNEELLKEIVELVEVLPDQPLPPGAPTVVPLDI